MELPPRAHRSPRRRAPPPPPMTTRLRAVESDDLRALDHAEARYHGRGALPEFGKTVGRELGDDELLKTVYPGGFNRGVAVAAAAERRHGPPKGGRRAGAAELAADYASGALHPGDLKPAVLAAVVKVLERVQDAFKTDKDAKQADAALKAFVKKSAKKK